MTTEQMYAQEPELVEKIAKRMADAEFDTANWRKYGRMAAHALIVVRQADAS